MILFMVFLRKACLYLALYPALYLALYLALCWTILPARALASDIRTPVIIFVAASLQPVLLAIQQRHRLDLRLVPASSGLLARQIASGAPADLYITADTQWTMWLKEQSVAMVAHKTFLSNTLAFVEPVSQKDHNEETLSASQTRLRLLNAQRIAVGDPSHVPVGLYARQVFSSLALDKPSFLAKLIPLINTRATVLHIEREEAPLGIVYRSDALFAKRISPPRMRIAGYLPSDLHEPIAYDLVLLEAKASALYDFFSSADARRVFFRFGFSPP